MEAVDAGSSVSAEDDGGRFFGIQEERNGRCRQRCRLGQHSNREAMCISSSESWSSCVSSSDRTRETRELDAKEAFLQEGFRVRSIWISCTVIIKQSEAAKSPFGVQIGQDFVNKTIFP